MTAAPEKANTTDPVADILTHATALVRKEIVLARAEMRASVRAAAMGIAMILATVVTALVAINTLSAALFAWVTWLGLDAGWAALWIGLGFAGLTVALGVSGASLLRPKALAPTETLSNVQADLRAVKEGLADAG